jgi:hypothetical protein
MVKKQWRIWKTVTIAMPGFNTPEDFFKALRLKRRFIDKYAEAAIKAMIPKLTVEEKEINLALARPDFFGLSGSIKLYNFFEAAIGSGLALVPQETGVYFAIQNDCQKYEERFHMAIDPVILEKSGPCGLFLYEEWLTGDCADSNTSLMPDGLWAFMLPS